jgi:hypothetical protein
MSFRQLEALACLEAETEVEWKQRVCVAQQNVFSSRHFCPLDVGR